MSVVRQRINTLEWDKKHNQLNAGMEPVFAALKKEYGACKEQFDKLIIITPAKAGEEME